jgi:hypothetical protein
MSKSPVPLAQDTTKTKSSMRTLPLVAVFKEKLPTLKEQQTEYKRLCGKCYDKQYLDYICVDEMGTLVSPHYVISAFPKLLDKHSLRKIRFHDLRHPYVKPRLKKLMDNSLKSISFIFDYIRGHPVLKSHL